jgi:amino-acid N-acetyltransferase
MSDDATALRDDVALIRDVFTYAHRFIGSIFVFRLSSRVIDNPHFPSLVQDLALLHENGIRIVIVPSGGARIDALLASYGITTERVAGLRISTPEAMPLIQMAAFDAATTCMNQLARNKIEGLIGNWVRARAMGVRDGVDYQDTGILEKVQTDPIRRSLDDDFVPILPCIGWNAVGKPYNISSMELATKLAVCLGARKLFFLTDGEPFGAEELKSPHDGVATDEGYLSRISSRAAESLITEWPAILEPIELELLTQAVAACRGGVERVHFVDGTIDGVVLKEIFSTLGYGIMIHSDPFENIRAMRADDIPDVLRVMEPAIKAGILVRRTEEDLQHACQEYVVFETDSTIRGCGSLRHYGDEQAEIAGIAVDGNYGHLGIGQKIVGYLIEEARRRGLRQVFILTTKTADWFLSLGFSPATVDDLPPERRAIYDEKRKSRIYIYPLEKA